MVSLRRGSHRGKRSRPRAQAPLPGRLSPALDDAWFAAIDSEAKAYVLGWIASRGTIERGAVALRGGRDRTGLRALQALVAGSLPLAQTRADRAGFTVRSPRVAADVARWLDLAPGAGPPAAAFPRLAPEPLGWAFVRGVFDAGGEVSAPDAGGGVSAAEGASWPAPRCSIASPSPRLLDAIAGFTGVPAERGADALAWCGANALDLLGKLYAGATQFDPGKRERYLAWCSWLPGGATPGGAQPVFRWSRTRPDAVAPAKRSVSDSGFDLTLLEAAHCAGAVTFYRTGIRVQPAFGWYFDVVPRSSIAKSGYMLANSVGVIDRGYTGEILVPLIKIDPQAPDLVLPARLVQIIPRPIIAAQLVEVDAVDDTARGAGGFGSTG